MVGITGRRPIFSWTADGHNLDRRCDYCYEVIDRDPVTREISCGPTNSQVGWLYFCSAACEENDRVAGSEPDYPEEGR